MANAWNSADAATFKRLCALFCTADEICALMELPRDELDETVSATFPEFQCFADASALFASEGRRNLRAAQMQAALNGNTTMQIWLGKQYLGQKDAPEAEQPKPVQSKEVPLNVILNRHAERRAPAKAARRA